MDIWAKGLILIVIFLMFVLIIFERVRLSKLEKKLDSMAKESQEFMKLLLFHFETKKKHDKAK